MVENGNLVSMSRLKSGDKVKTGQNIYNLLFHNNNLDEKDGKRNVN